MAGYVWSTSTNTWKPLTSGYKWNSSDSSWKKLTTGYVWSSSTNTWKLMFSSGTFLPEIRSSLTGLPITVRDVGVSMTGYRGDTAIGSYAYQWQYNSDANQDEVFWNNQFGTNNSGTLVSTNLTTNYTTDTTDLNVLNFAPYILWMRFRVTRSGETQYSQVIRITKRQPSVRSGTTPFVQGTRYLGSGKFDPLQKNPYINDSIQHISSWTLTTTLSGDTRPDYYIYTWTTGSGIYTQDSRTLDTDPSAPKVANVYIVKFQDLLAPISVDAVAYTSNPTNTSAGVITTRNVSDGVLQAPKNLSLTFFGGRFNGSWDASDGGIDTQIIYYDVILERDTVEEYRVRNTQGLSFTYLPTLEGTYRFKVIAKQSGSSDKTSEYSNEYLIEPPKAFTYTIANVTATDYIPGDFTINSPTEKATVANSYDWTWTASSGASRYTTTLIKPSGLENSEYSVGTAQTDYYNIYESGLYKFNVFAYNETKNYVRISWTKPANTTAVSYKITYGINSYYSGPPYYSSSVVTVTAGDVGYIDIPFDTPTFTAYFTGRDITISSVIAYSQDAQTGLQRTGTANFPISTTINAKSVRKKTLETNLTYYVVSPGTVTVNGITEPNQILSYSKNNDWSPPATQSGWTFTQQWKKTRIYPSSLTDINVTTAATTIPTTSDVGEYFNVVVTGTYKGTTVVAPFASSTQIVPGPPSFTLADSFSQKINVTSIVSAGGSFFFGSYDTGTGTATIAETSATSFQTATVQPGSRSVTLFGRAKKSSLGIQDIIDGTRSTTNPISIADPPQATGQQRFVTCLSIFRGSALTVATNGFVGYRAGSSPTGVTIPPTGNYLNIANRDIVQTNLYTYSNADGVWIRFQGYQYLASSKLIDYQVYFPWQSASAYVYFVRNDLDNYRSNDANINFGTVATTYLGNGYYQAQNLLNTAIMVSRPSTTAGSLDDGYTDFTPTAPGVAVTWGTPTSVSNGFTVPISNWNAGVDSSWTITFNVTPAIYSPTAVLNASTGVVTVSLNGASRTGTITATSSKTGYDSATSQSVSGTSLNSAPGSFSGGVSISKSGSTSGTLTMNSTVSSFGTPAGTQNWYWNAPGYPGYHPNSSTYSFDSGDAGTTITVYSYLTSPSGEWAQVNSGTASITLPAIVTIPSVPGQPSVSPSGFASWVAVNGATGYTIQWQRASSQSGTSPTGTTTTDVGASTGYQIPAVSGKIWARARVSARNSAGPSAYSPYSAWS